MFYDSGLIATALLYAWIAGDLAFARGRERFPGIAIAALAVAVWCIGELLVRHAGSPGELLSARRILFLGVCSLGPAWFLGMRAATGVRQGQAILGIASVLPGAVAYASLYFDSKIFVDAASDPLVRGPLFAMHAVASWLLVFCGVWIGGRHVYRLGARWQMHVALSLAAGAPFLANVVYVATGFPGLDPTPIALGVVGVALRFILLETGLAPDVKMLARREVFDQLGQGLIVADAFGEIVEANPAALEITGMDSLLGEPLDDVVAHATRHPFRVIEAEATLLERAGSRFGTAVVLEDRTEIRAAEVSLEIATRFEALGFLISGVTHQISNPLAYVRGNLDLMSRLVAALGERPDFIETLPAPVRRIAREGDSIVRDAIVGADRITALVRRLGSLARTDVNQPPGAVDLSMLATQAVELAGAGRTPGQIRIEREDPLPMVVAREQDLLQILLHLLINAIQASDKDGRIDVELRAGDDSVSVLVLDRGPGIPAELLPVVFDPFFTTKDGEANLGLGLSLSYELARQNGARLAASQRDGGGAAFELRFPLSASVTLDDDDEP